MFYFEKAKEKKEKKPMPMDKQVLQNCPKLNLYLKTNIVLDKDLHIGTKFRGVSKNGRNSW